MNTLEKLLYLTGVSADYLDYSGNRQVIPMEMRVETLRKMGYNVDSEEAIEKAVFHLDALHWTQLCRAFNIVHQNDLELTIYCAPDRLMEPINWSLELIDSAEPRKEFVSATGKADAPFSGQVIPGELRETGEYYIEGRRYSSHALQLAEPPLLPLGYFTLRLQQGTQQVVASLAVCPSKSYGLINDNKSWGFGCQLYTLRSARNCGHGDFADLRELIQLAHKKGADFIGINPLHAPISSSSEAPSPYSPSDRRRVNPLYIAIEQIPEVRDSVELQAQIRAYYEPIFTALRASDQIDYELVARIKYSVFELVYDGFLLKCSEPGSHAGDVFNRYIQTSGSPLADFAAYEIKHNKYANRHRNDARFYHYLQWLAEQQLAECNRYARDLGMPIGLLGDLAVGAVAEGCEVQMNPDLYLAEVKIGAPPDPFSETGQNWGLPVSAPNVLRQQDFRHFINLLQANMRHVGALRIDHAMALMRLWWCLPGEDRDPRDGVYVYYPLAELMAILRLESQLNECVIVAEDLGVVPLEFRQEMAASGLLGNKVFYFEQDFDGRFFQPEEQPSEALLMITNHDVSTLSEWWSGKDLRRRNELGLFSADVFTAEEVKRDQDRVALLRWLMENETLPSSWSISDQQRNFDFDLCKAIHQTCARSNAKLLSLQLEDLQMDIPPINIPGTSTEYSNWRGKQLASTKTILNSQVANNIFNAVNEERKQSL